MGKAYDLDLRHKVVQAVDEGMTQKEVAKLFNISRKTICNWLELRANIDNLQAKVGYQKGHSHKIIDTIEFEKFVNENKSCTSLELAEKWSELKNVKIGIDIVYRALKKIGYTHKQERSVAWTQKI